MKIKENQCIYKYFSSENLLISPNKLSMTGLLVQERLSQGLFVTIDKFSVLLFKARTSRGYLLGSALQLFFIHAIRASLLAIESCPLTTFD